MTKQGRVRTLSDAKEIGNGLLSRRDFIARVAVVAPALTAYGCGAESSQAVDAGPEVAPGPRTATAEVPLLSGGEDWPVFLGSRHNATSHETGLLKEWSSGGPPVVWERPLGEAYGAPTQAMVEAVTLLARLEGLLLDPVYSGKAMAGLIDLVRRGFFAADDTVVFIHTGGLPALFAYRGAFEDLQLE